MARTPRPTLRIRSLCFAGPVAAAGLIALSGCAQSQVQKVRLNLTPSMRTLHETGAEQQNNLAIYYNENLRMMAQDLGRFWYTDRPSRLTREPIPHP